MRGAILRCAECECVYGAGVMGGVERVIIYVFGLKDLEQLATPAVIKHMPIHSYSGYN